MRNASRSRRKMYVYLVIFSALCLFSLFAGALAPHDAELVDLLSAKLPPGGGVSDGNRLAGKMYLVTYSVWSLQLYFCLVDNRRLEYADWLCDWFD